MSILDKKHFLSEPEKFSQPVLELGCGRHKRHPEAIGVDALDYDGVDIVGDVFEVLHKVPDQTVHAIYSYHFLEHIEELAGLVQEMARVLVPGGTLSVVVPHFSSPYFYSDYTHKTSFGLYSFSYFARDDLFSRKVPTYDLKPSFILQDVELVFKSPVPFYVRYGIKRLFHCLFNLNRYVQELYEENFCYWVPCYEIRYDLQRCAD